MQCAGPMILRQPDPFPQSFGFRGTRGVECICVTWALGSKGKECTERGDGFEQKLGVRGGRIRNTNFSQRRSWFQSLDRSAYIVIYESRASSLRLTSNKKMLRPPIPNISGNIFNKCHASL